MNYSRLSRIEHGTRPAPGLPEIRRLADSLDVDMSELLVSSGTPREVMERLLWSERLAAQDRRNRPKTRLPEWSLLFEKNTYRARVMQREGALCAIRLGEEAIDVFHFGRGRELTITIPPEVVLVSRDRPDPAASTAENILSVRVKKIRRLGGVTNLVLVGAGFELNALHAERSVERLGLAEGDPVYIAIPITAIHT